MGESRKSLSGSCEASVEAVPWERCCLIPMATSEELPEALGKLLGEIVFAAMLLCLRGYLLMLCASWLIPFLVLPFWQWAVIGFTVRILLMPFASK